MILAVMVVVVVVTATAATTAAAVVVDVLRDGIDAVVCSCCGLTSMAGCSYTLLPPCPGFPVYLDV